MPAPNRDHLELEEFTIAEALRDAVAQTRPEKRDCVSLVAPATAENVLRALKWR